MLLVKWAGTNTDITYDLKHIRKDISIIAITEPEDLSESYINNGFDDVISINELWRLRAAVLREINRKESIIINQKNIKAAFAAVPFGMITVNKEYKITSVNSAFLKMFNLSCENVIGKIPGEVINCTIVDEGSSSCENRRRCAEHFGDCKFIKAINESMYTGKANHGIELKSRLPQKNSNLFNWYSIDTIPMQTNDTEINVLIIINDISEKMRIQKETEKLGQFYLSILENMPDMVWSSGLRGKYDYYNKNWLNFCGNAWIKSGKDHEVLIHHEDLESYRKVYLKAYETKEKFEIGYRLKRFDGEFRHIYTRAMPLNDICGEFSGFIGVSKDITEEKLAEEGLKRYQILSQNANEYILYIDDKGNIIDMNKSALQGYGYSYDEFTKKTIYDIREDKGEEDFLEDLYSAAIKGTIFESTHIRKDRSTFPVELSVKSMSINGQNILLAIVRDITDRKKAEEELRKAKEEAEAASRAKSEFLANMSHEIRTPLNGIIGMTDLTLMTSLSEEQRDNLKIVKFSADSLLSVINDILDFSKIEAGKMSIEKIDFNIIDLMQEITNVHWVTSKEKGIDITYSLHPDIPPVLSGDPYRLRQILNNLLGNAIKFTDKGKVALNVKKLQDDSSTIKLMFSVSDTGIGIGKENAGRIFKAFSQVDGSITRKYGGTGLGLTISKKLVEMMGGSIGVESYEGKGSTFHFTVEFGINTTSQKHDKGSKKLEKLNDNIKVLLVEDDRINQVVIKCMLKELGCSIIEVASNGLEALRILKNNKFDVVLMDVQMPEMDGIEATRAIRKEEINTKFHLPIIAITAYALKGDREKFISQGMDEYIAKPVNINELAEVLRKVEKFKETQTVITSIYKKASKRYNCKIYNVEQIKKAAEEITNLLYKNTLNDVTFFEIGRVAHVIKNYAEETNLAEIKNMGFKIELASRRKDVKVIENLCHDIKSNVKKLISDK